MNAKLKLYLKLYVKKLVTIFLPVLVVLPLTLTACAGDIIPHDPISSLQLNTTLWLVDRAFDGVKFTQILEKDGMFAIFGLLKDRGWGFTIVTSREIPINTVTEIGVAVRRAGVAAGEDVGKIVEFMKERGWQPALASSVPEAVKTTVKAWLHDISSMDMSLFVVPAMLISPEGLVWGSYLEAPMEVQ